jgi:serine/threonine protein kinase/tetratricopeptide (TPR) repeat protein
MQTSPEQHDERVMRMVSQARGRSPGEREDFLRSECETDSNLYQEIVDTLNWEERMGSFLQQPLVALTLVGRRFRPGEVVEGRFEILRTIGEGGMGVVYEAIDRKRNLRIAIKSAKPGFQRLLSPELESALKVRHPNICLVNQIHATRTEAGEIDFLSMEFLEGETLSAYLEKRGRLGAAETLDIARQLCAGVSEAHRSGIVHGDLKSGNIFLCPTENERLRAVITDFGLASSVNQTAGECGGTPEFMAPELWQGERPSRASDIYALGVILYQLLTGRLPFEGRSFDSWRTPPTTPSDLVKGLDSRWDRVILDCLSDSPQVRPSDAAEVIARLEKRPLRKAPLIAVALIATAASIPQIRERVIDLFTPANVRLAILPYKGASDEAATGEGALEDVSDRLRHLSSARRTLAVIPLKGVSENGVRSPEQASKVLHATHALQVSLRKDGEDYIAEGSVIDLVAQAHIRDFSSRYTKATIGAFPSALAGEVSLALRLHSAAVPEALSTAATAPYDKGLFLLRNDRQTFDDAIAMFKEAARLDPRSPLPPAALVEAQMVKHEITNDRHSLQEAQIALRQAQGLNPDSARVLLAAGLLNQASGHNEQALEDYRRVLELEPRNVDAFLRTANVYDQFDMPDKAVEAFQKAIELDPAYFEPYEELGLFYFYRGRYPQAAEEFRRAIDRAPGIVDAYTSLGSVLGNLGQYAEAEQALLSSMKLRETAPVLNDMGVLRVYERRDAEAVDYFRRATVADPNDKLYLLNLADAEWRLRHYQNARVSYRKAMALALNELNANPGLSRTRAFVAYFAARLGDTRRAEDEISQALQLTPGDNNIVRRAVLTYETLGQRERGLAVLDKATPELLRELDRQPDLADFCLDPRFQQLISRNTNGGN